MILWETYFKKSFYKFDKQQFEPMDFIKLITIFDEMHDSLNNPLQSPCATPLSNESVDTTPNQHLTDTYFPIAPLHPLSCHNPSPPTITELSPDAPAHIRALFDNFIFTETIDFELKRDGITTTASTYDTKHISTHTPSAKNIDSDDDTFPFQSPFEQRYSKCENDNSFASHTSPEQSDHYYHHSSDEKYEPPIGRYKRW